MYMSYLAIILVAVLLIYIFYLYQAVHSENTCYAALFFSLCHRLGSRGRQSDRLTKFQEMRTELILREKKTHIGGSIVLNALEQEVNQKILKEKELEYDEGFVDPKNFKPSKHFYSVMDKISATPLFQMIRTMPKGGLMHIHDTSLASSDILLEMTYRENLWVLRNDVNDALSFSAFRFSREDPSKGQSSWILLKKLRNDVGAAKVDEALMKRFTLYPRENYTDQNDVWVYFLGIFILIEGLLTYAPIWREFFYKGLQELYDDGVQYVEIRSYLPAPYDLDQKEYTAIDSVRIWQEESLKFKNEHDDFIGVKVIYAPLRDVPDHIVEEYMKTALELKETFPDFFAGFDLVNKEDNSRALKEFAEPLIGIQNEINFYFHAGETNWFGTTTDENLIDAVLLGTKRIGHGFAIVKHPEVLRIVKQHDIAIEINPISNQVLLLVSDFRNHPCAQLFAENYPVVISSDDRLIFKSTPLSHDFYIAFLGIASRSAGLGMLKQLAWNSLKYSSLDEKSKDVAFEKFINKWNKWLEQVKEMKIQRRDTDPAVQKVVAQPMQEPAPCQAEPLPAPQPSRQSCEEQALLAVQQQVRHSGQQQARQSVEQPARLSAQQAARQSAEQPVRQSGQQQARQSVEQPARQSMEQPARQSMEQPARQSVEQPARQSADQPARQSANQPARQSADQSARQSADQSARLSTQQPIQAPAQESVEEPAPQSRKNSLEPSNKKTDDQPEE